LDPGAARDADTGARIQLEMREALITLIVAAVMFGLVGGYFLLALRSPRITGSAFTAVGAACALLSAWQLLYAGPGTPHVVYGFVSLLGAAGCLLIGISTLVHGGPGRRR
jgi:hypothetical protein